MFKHCVCLFFSSWGLLVLLSCKFALQIVSQHQSQERSIAHGQLGTSSSKMMQLLRFFHKSLSGREFIEPAFHAVVRSAHAVLWVDHLKVEALSEMCAWPKLNLKRHTSCFILSCHCRDVPLQFHCIQKDDGCCKMNILCYWENINDFLICSQDKFEGTICQSKTKRSSDEESTMKSLITTCVDALALGHEMWDTLEASKVQNKWEVCSNVNHFTSQSHDFHFLFLCMSQPKSMLLISKTTN